MVHRKAICTAFFGVLLSSPFASAQLDLNDDGVIDCDDAGILHNAILTGSQDARFDFDGSGDVGTGDFHWWIGRDARGDVNLDGRVDAQDSNILGINWVQETDGGWCHGDTSLDGRVNARDKGETQQNWMIGGRSRATPSNVVEIGDGLAIWKAGMGAVIAESALFEVVATPKAAPDGLLATVIAVRAKAETDRVVTFRDIEFRGDLHQLWIPGHQLPVPTPIRDFIFLPEFFDPFLEMDSHILVEHYDVGITFGGGHAGIYEENDESNPTNQQLVFESVPFPTGLGRLFMASPTDAFTLHRGFPDDPEVESAQKQSVDVAHLVTPARMPGTDLPGEVSYRLGVLGSSELDEPLDDMPIFGFDENLRIPFLFRPCDFARDGVCATGDLDQLLSAVGNEDPTLDLVGDDALITLDDRDAWLAWAADGRFSSPLLVGDSNLDGIVDSSDLNALALRWGQVHGDGWAGGDFDGNGQTNAADLNALALNWQVDVRQPVASAVPEPSCTVLFLTMVTLTAGYLRKRR